MKDFTENSSSHSTGTQPRLLKDKLKEKNVKNAANLGALNQYSLNMGVLPQYLQEISVIRLYRMALLLVRNEFLLTLMKQGQGLFDQFPEVRSQALEILGGSKFSNPLDPRNYNQYAVLHVNVPNVNITERHGEAGNVIHVLLNILTLTPVGFLRKADSQNLPDNYYLLPMHAGADGNLKESLPGLFEVDLLDTGAMNLKIPKLKGNNPNPRISKWIDDSYKFLLPVTSNVQLPGTQTQTALQGGLGASLQTLEGYINNPINFCRNEIDTMEEETNLDFVMNKQKALLSQQPQSQGPTLIQSIEDFTKTAILPIQTNTLLLLIVMCVLGSPTPNLSVSDSQFLIGKDLAWSPLFTDEMANIIGQHLPGLTGSDFVFDWQPIENFDSANFVNAEFGPEPFRYAFTDSFNITMKQKESPGRIFDMHLTNNGLTALNRLSVLNPNNANPKFVPFQTSILRKFAKEDYKMSGILYTQLRQNQRFHQSGNSFDQFRLLNDNILELSIRYSKAQGENFQFIGTHIIMPTPSDVADSLNLGFLTPSAPEDYQESIQKLKDLHLKTSRLLNDQDLKSFKQTNNNNSATNSLAETNIATTSTPAKEAIKEDPSKPQRRMIIV